MKSSLLTLVATVGTMASAMAADVATFAELQQAVSEAQDGDTICVDNDIECDGELVFPAGSVTLTSVTGETNALVRAASYSGTIIRISNADSVATIRDLVLDGNKADGSYTAYPVHVSAGSLTLAEGGVIRNFKGRDSATGGGGAVYVSGGDFTMEEGAEISGCEASSWGVAVQVNNTKSHFYMYGGLITGCVDSTSGSPASGYGGTVYIYTGNVVMTNGLITGNSSEKSTAGVLAYNGTLSISGGACITNNVGGKGNDIYLTRGQYGNGQLVFETWRGPFRGHATVYMLDPPEEGVKMYPGFNTWCTQNYPVRGLSGIVCEQWPEYVLDGSSLIGGYYPQWYKRAVIAGRGVSGSFNDLADQLEDGDTLELHGDVMATCAVIVDSPGSRVVIKGNGHRITSCATKFGFYGQNGATLRLEDVTVDGGVNAAPILFAATGGRLEVGGGTVVENVKHSNCPVVGYITGAGSEMTMEDGAEIRNCRGTISQAWGGISIGNGADVDPLPRFVMSGGFVTNNVLHSQSVPNHDGYGGMVYCYKGRFEMSGGTIAHNECTNAVSGVNVYNGSVVISGTAKIKDNLPGYYPDLYLLERNGSTGMLSGDFGGHVGVSSGSQRNDDLVGFDYENVSSGACRIFSASNGKYGQLSAYTWSQNHKLYFYTAADWIGGIGCPQQNAQYYLTESVASLVPEEIDANSGELPVVFEGERALALSGTIRVAFDPEAVDKENFEPITLLHAKAGDANGVFAGVWSLELPEECKGKWIVRRVNEGSDYVLCRIENVGAVMIIR